MAVWRWETPSAGIWTESPVGQRRKSTGTVNRGFRVVRGKLVSIRHAACVAAVVVVTLVVAPARAFQPDIERENLAGIREVNVVGEDLAEDAEASGLTGRALLTAVERQLETRGVPQGSSRQGADLYINVATHQGTTGLYAYYARVSVQQLATIEGNQLRSLVDTWARASLGAVGAANLSQVEQVVMQLVDLFCDDYFEVNDRVR